MVIGGWCREVPLSHALALCCVGTIRPTPHNSPRFRYVGPRSADLAFSTESVKRHSVKRHYPPTTNHTPLASVPRSATSALAATAAEICTVCRWLHDRNLLAATDGNVSARLPDGRILITPSGLGKARLRPADLAVLTSDGAVERAFSEGRILRTHVMRPTWHFVSPDDIHWLLELTAPRVHATNAYMYRQSGSISPCPPGPTG